MNLTQAERIYLAELCEQDAQALSEMMSYTGNLDAIEANKRAVALANRLREDEVVVYLITKKDVFQKLAEVEDEGTIARITDEEKPALLAYVRQYIDPHEELYSFVDEARSAVLCDRSRKEVEQKLKGKFIEPKGTME